MATDRFPKAAKRFSGIKPLGDESARVAATSMALAANPSREDSSEEASTRQELTDMCRDRLRSCVKAFGKRPADAALTELDSLETWSQKLWEPFEQRILRADPEDVKWCRTVFTDDEESASGTGVGGESAPSVTWNLTLSVNQDKTALTVTGSFACISAEDTLGERDSCLRFQYDVSIASLKQSTWPSATAPQPSNRVVAIPWSVNQRTTPYPQVHTPAHESVDIERTRSERDSSCWC